VKLKEPYPNIQKILFGKEASFDKRKQTNLGDAGSLPLNEFMKNHKPSDTPIALNCYCGKFKFKYSFYRSTK
jgi:hypothetical protein